MSPGHPQPCPGDTATSIMGQGKERGGSDAKRIVTDAATQPWPKSRPPLRGRPEKAAGSVERLVRAASPACSVLLAGGLLRAIPAIAGTGYGP